MNNADYGMTLQRIICKQYGIEENAWAQAQFNSNYNPEYENEMESVIQEIFKKLAAKPKKLLTYSESTIDGHKVSCPHNFLLDNGKTLSIRTTKTSDKVAPRTVGQAGFSVLNEFFADIYGKEIQNQADIRILVYEHIHEMLPIFIDYLFQSDYTVFINSSSLNQINIIRLEDVSEYSFSRNEFSFTRGPGAWTESTTLRYHGVSIAEIQTHKQRSFKFRFVVSKIPEWFNVVKENNETLGMSAEAAICEYFKLEKPASFKTRVLRAYVNQLIPIIGDSFRNLPNAIKHSGSTVGERGEQSKCSYDFILDGNLTLSLKTNKGRMVCPPEVGQPGSKTCLLYFSRFLEEGVTEVTGEMFKRMVLENIEELMPIYVEHLFDSDWLLWIYESRSGFEHMEIKNKDIREFQWDKSKFTFTRPTIEEWNESNTVKYEGLTIGEFQVHHNRSCYKFRFNMMNLMHILYNPMD